MTTYSNSATPTAQSPQTTPPIKPVSTSNSRISPSSKSSSKPISGGSAKPASSKAPHQSPALATDAYNTFGTDNVNLARGTIPLFIKWKPVPHIPKQPLGYFRATQIFQALYHQLSKTDQRRARRLYLQATFGNAPIGISFSRNNSATYPGTVVSNNSTKYKENSNYTYTKFQSQPSNTGQESIPRSALTPARRVAGIPNTYQASENINSYESQKLSLENSAKLSFNSNRSSSNKYSNGAPLDNMRYSQDPTSSRTTVGSFTHVQQQQPPQMIMNPHSKSQNHLSKFSIPPQLQPPIPHSARDTHTRDPHNVPYEPYNVDYADSQSVASLFSYKQAPKSHFQHQQHPTQPQLESNESAYQMRPRGNSVAHQNNNMMMVMSGDVVYQPYQHDPDTSHKAIRPTGFQPPVKTQNAEAPPAVITIHLTEDDMSFIHQVIRTCFILLSNLNIFEDVKDCREWVLEWQKLRGMSKEKAQAMFEGYMKDLYIRIVHSETKMTVPTTNGLDQM